MRAQKELVEQYPGIGFTYIRDDPEDLADKIKKLYDDRELLQNCKEKSLEVAANELNREKESKKWLRLINKLLYDETILSPGNKIASPVG